MMYFSVFFYNAQLLHKHSFYNLGHKLELPHLRRQIPDSLNQGNNHLIFSWRDKMVATYT